MVLAERPSVLKRPEAVIIGLQNATTNPPTFTCVVGGAPAPTLFWTYIPGLDEGRSILLLDGDEYDVSSNTTVQDNGLVMVTSTVTFLKVVNTDGGIVRCNARPGSAYENALLTVLGMYLPLLLCITIVSNSRTSKENGNQGLYILFL